MKLLPIALLTLSLASPSFAGGKPDETVTTTGSRIRTPGSSSPGAFPGHGGRPGRPQLEKQRFEEVVGSVPNELTNAQVLLVVMDQWRETVQTLSQMQAWGELDVTITLKDGTKIDVHLKVGFGKTEVLSTKKK
jgi:hypothetical protein